MQKGIHKIEWGIVGLVLWGILAALALIGCQNDPGLPTTIDITNNNTNTNNNGQGGTGATAEQGCTPSDAAPTQLSITALSGAGTVPAGGVVTLNATPKPLSSDTCNLARGISWTETSPSVCTLSDKSDFTPNLQALAGQAGKSCQVSACVKGACAAFSIPVV